MKNRILIFVIVILLINFISAYEIKILPKTTTPISMFSGETKVINLTLCHDFNQKQKLDLSYNIINNIFNLDGLSIFFLENPIYTNNCKDIQLFIVTHPSYKPDSWSLETYAETLYEEKIYTSRGGGYSSYWECGEWGECINGTQIRICEDISRLNTKRVETRDCFPEFIPIRQEIETNETEGIIIQTTTSPGFFATITGAVIDTLEIDGIIFAITFIIILIAFILVCWYKRKKKII